MWGPAHSEHRRRSVTEAEAPKRVAPPPQNVRTAPHPPPPAARLIPRTTLAGPEWVARTSSQNGVCRHPRSEGRCRLTPSEEGPRSRCIERTTLPRQCRDSPREWVGAPNVLRRRSDPLRARSTVTTIDDVPSEEHPPTPSARSGTTYEASPLCRSNTDVVCSSTRFQAETCPGSSSAAVSTTLRTRCSEISSPCFWAISS